MVRANAGTFPEGLKFSSAGLGSIPPSVEAMLSGDGAGADLASIMAMLGEDTGGGGGSGRVRRQHGQCTPVGRGGRSGFPGLEEDGLLEAMLGGLSDLGDLGDLGGDLGDLSVGELEMLRRMGVGGSWGSSEDESDAADGVSGGRGGGYCGSGGESSASGSESDEGGQPASWARGAGLAQQRVGMRREVSLGGLRHDDSGGKNTQAQPQQQQQQQQQLPSGEPSVSSELLRHWINAAKL